MQRLMIARIFLLKPKILLADEPTSMIDACSRATILDMLLKLRDEINMTIIFITHDIGLAYYVSDNVYIMEHGKFVESGPAEEVILHPTAAYTKRLISDVPKIYEPWDLTTVYQWYDSCFPGIMLCVIYESCEKRAGSRKKSVPSSLFVNNFSEKIAF